MTLALHASEFGEYEMALESLRYQIESNPGRWLEEEEFRDVLRAFELYKYDLIDLEREKRIALALLEAHRQYLNVFSFKGLTYYLRSWLDNEYNGDGFLHVGGTLEMATYTELSYVVKTLRNEFPEAANQLAAYQQLLSRIEKSYQTACWILQKTALPYTVLLLKRLYRMPWQLQDFVLNALVGYRGNAAVIQFYQEYLGRTDRQYLREEAQRCLERVRTTAA